MTLERIVYAVAVFSALYALTVIIWGPGMALLTLGVGWIAGLWVGSRRG